MDRISSLNWIDSLGSFAIIMSMQQQGSVGSDRLDCLIAK